MQSLLKLTWVETKLFLRDLSTTFFSLAFPLLLLILYGSVYTNEPNAYFGEHGILDFYVPAYITLIIATNGILALPITLASYREKGVLLRLQATPLHPQAILGTEIMVNFLMTTAGTLLLVIVGIFVYHIHVFSNPLSILVAFILNCLSVFTLGFVIASLAPNARAAEFIGFVVYFPMMFLSGTTFPVKLFPPALQQVVQFLPLTQAVNLLQGLWLGDGWGDLVTPVVVLISFAVAGMLISVRFFRWR